jgi:hypothetical protein
LKIKIKQLLVAEAQTLHEAVLNICEVPYDKFYQKHPEFKSNAPPIPSWDNNTNADIVNNPNFLVADNFRLSTTSNNTNSSNPFLNQPHLTSPAPNDHSINNNNSKAILTTPSITASPSHPLVTTKRRDVKSLPPTPVPLAPSSLTPHNTNNSATMQKSTRRAVSVQHPNADIDDSVFSTPQRGTLRCICL